MGCISSKVVARSLSFQEERKQGSQRIANRIPLLEDLIISANGSDQYLALVHAANAVANKLHSRSFSSNTSSKLAIEPASSETIDKLEIPVILDRGEGKTIVHVDQRKRSKSCHWFPEKILSSLAQENSYEYEDKHDLSSKGAVRSRSFHTVEEYDDMLKKIGLSKSHRFQQSEFDDEDDGSEITMALPISNYVSDTSYHTEDKDPASKEMQVGEYKIVKEISFLSTAPESRRLLPSPKSHISSSGIKNKEVVQSPKSGVFEKAAPGDNSINEKENKRKAVAKRLESLRIPSNIESPAIASLREWLPASGIYSPGSYVTPKFGSYSVRNGGKANESREDSTFSPELVSAFEQCMDKLEAEEENIIKLIIENLEEECGGEMQSQEVNMVIK